MTPSDRLHEINGIIEGKPTPIQSYESSPIEAIKFKSGQVCIIEYRRVNLAVSFEKRGRRFKPAWGPWTETK